MALPTGQRRHFMCTLWPLKETEAPSVDEMDGFKGFIDAWPNLQFASYQYEMTKTGKIHIQLYIEFKKSIRASTVLKMLKTLKDFKHSRVEFRKHKRESCKKYTTKNESRLENTEPVLLGVWRDSKKDSQKSSIIGSCAELIAEGKDANWIAYHRPELYLRYGTKIEATIHRRELYKQRQQLLAESKDDEEE
jgi:hypothetical protein